MIVLLWVLNLHVDVRVSPLQTYRIWFFCNHSHNLRVNSISSLCAMSGKAWHIYRKSKATEHRNRVEPLSVAWSRWLRYHSWTGRAFWLWHRIIWSGGGPSCRHDFDTFFRFDWVLSSSSNVIVGSYKWGRSQNWTTSTKLLKVACRINQKLKSLEQHVVEDVGSLDLATQCLWTGDAQLETNGLVFRLQSDMAIISHSKKMYPVCQFLRSLAIEQGLANMQIENHRLTQRFHQALYSTLIAKFQQSILQSLNFRLTAMLLEPFPFGSGLIRSSHHLSLPAWSFGEPGLWCVPPKHRCECQRQHATSSLGMPVSRQL